MALNLDPKAMLSSSKFSDLKARLVFLFFALIVYRIGAHVPVPGIDPDLLSQLFQGQQGGVLGMFNLFSGGALSRFTVFALGVMPYISASIIMQLMTIAFPSLGNKNKEGDVGRREIVKYTRWLTVVLAIAQAGAMSMAIESRVGLVLHPGYAFRFTTILSLVTGTMFLMWLGEQITERGLGNGISVIIFSGIVSGLPTAVFGVGNLLSTGALSAVAVLVILFLVFLVTTSVIFVERGQRRITLNYAKRQVGSKVFAPQTSHLPLKLNMSGVVPPIFASSLILFPATLLQWGFSGSKSGGWANFVKEIASSLSPGHPLYIVLYISAIVFFCFFYTALVFNSRQTADNLKKSGAVLPGIRPGEQTARYIDRVLTRLTLCGAVYISLVCLLPEFLILKWNVPFYFGGTSLLIVVVVSMEFMTQIQTYFMSRHYESLLKKQG